MCVVGGRVVPLPLVILHPDCNLAADGDIGRLGVPGWWAEQHGLGRYPSNAAGSATDAREWPRASNHPRRRLNPMALSRRGIADPTVAPPNAARHTAAIPSNGGRLSSGDGSTRGATRDGAAALRAG